MDEKNDLAVFDENHLNTKQDISDLNTLCGEIVKSFRILFYLL